MFSKNIEHNKDMYGRSIRE